MLIEGLGTLVAFVVFVAPGVLWTWLAEHRRATTERSDVMDVALIALTSVIFSLPSGLLAVLLSYNWHLGNKRLIDAWFDNGVNTGDELTRLSLVLLVQLGLSVVLVLASFKLLSARIFGDLWILRDSHWTHELEKLPENPHLYAEVRIDDNVHVRGVVGSMSEQFDQEKRELTLLPPIRIETDDGDDLLDGRVPRTLTIPGGVIKFLALYKLENPPGVPGDRS